MPAVKRSWLLAAIMGVYLILGVVYIASIPPFEGPDEPQHFAYVTWLARTNRLPPAGEQAREAGIEHEASQHPLYYVLASLPVRLVDIGNPPIVYRPNPHFIGPLARDYPDNDNRAIHYEDDGRPLAGGWLALYLARGVTLLFGALLLACVYGLARQIWPARPQYALRCALVAAVLPQAIFLGAVVSNDVPVAALGAGTLWALALLLRRGYSARRAALLGAIFGLAVLTKASALALAAPLGLGLLWSKQRHGQSWSQFLTMCLLVGGAALLVAGWWFVRSLVLFGSPLGLETHEATTWAIVDPADVELAWRRWWEVFRSFWLWFGWGTLRTDHRVYYVLAALSLLSGAGLSRAAWRRFKRRGQPAVRLPAGSAQILALNAVAMISVALVLELWMRQVIAPFGRLLYPALGAIVVLLVAGWQRVHRQLPLAALAFLFVVAVLAPWSVLQPAYARPQPLTAEQRESLGSSLGLHFGPSFEEAFAELVTVDVLQESVAAGDVAPVRVCWRTLRTAQHDYSLLLQIIGPREQLVAGRRTYPGLGAYPTSQWQAGEVFCDRVQIEIRSDPAVEPLVYQLEVGMMDPVTNRRLPIYDAEGEVWPVAFVDRIRVYSPSLIEMAPPATVESGAPLRLIDFAVEDRVWRARETNDFVLRWAATAPLSHDYQVYVHLRNPEAMEPKAQADGPPLDGWYPTSWWPANEVVRDQRHFSLEPRVAAGEYHLFVGMYDLASGERVTPEYDLGPIVVER